MANWKHKGAMIVLLAISMFSFTGCTSGERIQRQLSYREQGIAYMEEGNYQEALEAFQSALEESLGKIDDTTLDICFYKAKTQYLSQDVDGAMDTYCAIIDYNSSPKAYFLRGNLYYTLGMEEEALADYKKATEIETTDYELYIAIYEVLMEMGKEKEGQEYLNQALEINAKTTADKLQKGRVHLLLEEYEDAISIFEEASVNEVDANYYLFEVYEAMGENTNADKYLNSYLESKKVDSYQIYEVGMQEMEKKHYTRAIRCFKKALELENVPNKQQVLQQLIRAYEWSYDFASAKEYMEEYIKEYPDDEEGWVIKEYTFLQTR